MKEMLPTHESRVTDGQFFAALDRTWTGLEKVWQAVDRGAYPQAKKELAEYFHNKKIEQYVFDYRGVPLKKVDEKEPPYLFQAGLGGRDSVKRFAVEAGRKLMEHIYTLPGNRANPIDLGANFEHAPHFNCHTDYGKKSRTPSNIFTRGQWMEYLFFLYQETGDEKVAGKFTDLLELFWEHYPLIMENESEDAERFQYTEDRTVMSVGWLAIVYLGLLYTELPYAAGDQVVCDILKHLWYLGVQFTRFREDIYRPFNHHLWERGVMPYILGAVLPEIPAFRVMKEPAAEIISRHVKEDFNPSGGYDEHSIGYWSGAALGEMLFRAIYLARINGEMLLDEDAEKRIRKSFDALAAIAPPGHAYPAVGDGGGSVVEEVLQLGVQMNGNQACEELLSYRRGDTGEVSAVPLYYSDDKAGFTCARTDFGSKATYMLMSTKVDCGRSGHNHMDMLSLNLWVRGEELIGESYAGHLYPRLVMGSRQRGYHYNMTSHNTVLAYGKPIVSDEMFAREFGVYRPDSPVLVFHTYPEGMYVEAMHGGYGFCGHYRQVVFASGGNLIVRDRIWPGQRIEGAHIQRWHLMQGVSCTRKQDQGLLLEKHGVRLLCLWNRAKRISIWKPEELLCPELYANADSLGWIVDVEFSGETVEGSDEKSSALTVLMADVTDKPDCKAEELRRWLGSVEKNLDSRQTMEALNHRMQQQMT